MENTFVPDNNAAVSGANYLTRDQLPGINNLFVISPANTGFLQGSSKHLPGRVTRLLPLLVVASAIIIVGVLALVLAGSPDGSGGLGVVIAVLAVIFVVLIAISVRSYQRANRLEKDGQLLQATITNVAVRERSGAANAVYAVLNIVFIILDLLDMFSSSSSSRRYRNSTLGYDPGDFYQINLEYKAVTPSGGQLSGLIKKNRPDLRKGTLPAAGGSIVLLYVDDSLYQPL